MRAYGRCLGVITLVLLAGCSQSDQEKARERSAEARQKAHEEAGKARQEAHELAHQAKQEAHALAHNIKDAVNGTGSAGNDSREARQKLRQGGDDLRDAGSRAEVKIDHAALIAKVKAKLANDAGLATVTNVDVDASGQVITLRGTVSSPEQKQLAENAARQVSGVSKVVNDLQVRQ